MATNVLTCFERLDESKYWHPNCLNATAECESEQIEPLLCGFSEYTGDGIVASIPPKKYLRKTNKWETYNSKNWVCCLPYNDNPGYHVGLSRTLLNSAPYVWLYNPDVDCDDDVLIQEPTGCFKEGGRGTFSFTNLPCNGSQTSGTGCIPNMSEMILTTASTTRTEKYAFTESFFPNGQPDPECDGQLSSQFERLYSSVLSEEDIEQDAIDRETPTAGTSCSSLWETRSTGFAFTKRTSEYTIECVGLVVGVEYEVTPTIRKRTAVIGSYGAWEDVTVASETFTATATTKTLPAVLLGDDGTGEIIQGYEYEITGVHIEKKA